MSDSIGSIKVKTISQLMTADKADVNKSVNVKINNNNVKLESLFEISVPASEENATKKLYVSKNVTITTLYDVIEEKIKNYFKEKTLNIDKYNTQLSIDSLLTYTNNLKTIFTINANKKALVTKENYTLYVNDDTDANNKVLIHGDVGSISEDINRKLIISNQSNVVALEGETQFIELREAVENDNDKGYTVAYTGYLNLIGWVADNGTVALGNSWISLQAKIGGTWTTIQYQPWILGERHKQVQLVTFNALIAKDTQIRLRSGFKLNEANSGFQNTNNNITGLSPNKFKVIYVYNNELNSAQIQN